MSQKLRDSRVLMRDLGVGLAVVVVVTVFRFVGWLVGAWATIWPQ